MDRNKPVITTVRAARFSSAAHDEIELSYPFEGIAGHQDNGKLQLSFYDKQQYDQRQFKHGHDIYPTPEPFTDGHFKR